MNISVNGKHGLINYFVLETRISFPQGMLRVINTFNDDDGIYKFKVKAELLRMIEDGNVFVSCYLW